MGIEKKFIKEKLIIAVLYADKADEKKLEKILVKKFGLIDYKSQWINFTYTNYYKEEMGPQIWRKFYSIKKLVNPANGYKFKILANQIEKNFFFRGTTKRKINLDPGILSLGKFILFTTKNQQHRIPLNKGIYAEVTLRFHQKQFTTWEWTYRDYQTDIYWHILSEIRSIYKNQIQHML